MDGYNIFIINMAVLSYSTVKCLHYQYLQLLLRNVGCLVMLAYGMSSVFYCHSRNYICIFRIILVSTAVKIALGFQLPYSSHNNSNNSSSIYCLLTYSALHPQLLLFRLLLYPIFCLFLSAQLTLYFMLILQSSTLLYRYYYFTYFIP